MRLDFLVANGANLSRKEARRSILAERVTINGTVCKKAATPLAGDETVTLDDEPLTLPGERYLMLNKPEGVVSATSDGEHVTALDLLPSALRRNLHIAGRLDLDTTGLLLLTTDGQWSHRVTSPKANCDKTYRVQLAEPITADMIHSLEAGITLRGEKQPTRPARVEQRGEQDMRLTISEGRYHQVKRMLAAVGNHVTALHREAVGAITLDSDLAPGDYRELTRAEIGAF